MKEDLSMSPPLVLPPLTLPPSALPTPPGTSALLPEYPTTRLRIKRENINEESDEDKYFDEDDDVDDNDNDIEYTPDLNSTRRRGSISVSVSVTSTPSSSAIIQAQKTPRYGPTTGTPLIDHPKEEHYDTTATTSTPDMSNNSFSIADHLPPLSLPQPALSSPNDSVLPPPPSRACTIIQTVPSDMSGKKNSQSGGRRKRAKKDETPVDDEQRKKARRTSHSDIERRRRLKINEQFEALRQLVPACSQLTTAKRGGDIGLHKLDILQESVAFIKHLIECVNTIEKRLQQQNGGQSTAPSPLVLPSINSAPSHPLSITPPTTISRRPSITTLPSNYALKPTHHEPASPLTGPRDKPITHNYSMQPASISAPPTAAQSPHMYPTQRSSMSSASSPIPNSTDTSKLRISNLVG